ncbi:hypothetical protein BDQ12DRAFT_719386 [Crucibulum laeve]|uniref:Uncharacterized protein n=1 Tax=Crucibulum laeve TaxID=68775 RepID=A0A5C3MCW5_9AGAR|nr:hypothetical protein BDQ12DRAFT_719386 [Crucibulum laeve]
MPPVLLSRGLDPILGVFTGFLAFYLYETHPRNNVPADQRLAELVRWKWVKYQQKKQEEMRALDAAT